MDNIIITIDPRQNRIRFYRAFLKELGQPKYVDLLINTEKKILAVRNCGNSFYSAKLNSDVKREHCYELYSQQFIHRIFELAGWADITCTYKIVGTMDEATQTAFFELMTATKIDSEE